MGIGDQGYKIVNLQLATCNLTQELPFLPTLLFYLGASFFFSNALFFGGFGGFGAFAGFGWGEGFCEKFLQADNGRIPITALASERLYMKLQDACFVHAILQLFQQQCLLLVRQTGRIGNVKEQRHARLGLVDMLPARPAAFGKTELQLIERNLQIVVDRHCRFFVHHIWLPQQTHAAKLIYMESIFNQYSALIPFIIGAILLMGGIFFFAPKKARPWLLLGGLAVLTVGGFILFQPEPQGVAQEDVALMLAQGNGRPVFLELYSDY